MTGQAEFLTRSVFLPPRILVVQVAAYLPVPSFPSFLLSFQPEAALAKLA